MNRKTTIVLVIAFGVLMLYVLLVQMPKDKVTAGATPTTGPSNRLWDVTAEQVTGVWIAELSTRRGVAFDKDSQGIWNVTVPQARQADQNLASTQVGRFVNLFVTTTITGTTDLATFGVLSPTYTLGIKLVDGSELQAAVGDKIATGTGYYVLRDGEVDVVVVSSSAIDGLVTLLDSPPYFVPTQAPSPSPQVTETPPAPAATP